MNTQPQVVQQLTVFLPLIVGGVTTLLTIFIHGASARTMILFVVSALRRGVAGVSFYKDVFVLAGGAMMLLSAHLVEVALWAAALLVCGEFHGFAVAFYHSAVNFTTLGYGDIVMSSKWRFMGPLEALDGMLLVGISTAVFFAVVQRIARSSQPELWEEIHR